jgi:hypothetical protein
MIFLAGLNVLCSCRPHDPIRLLMISDILRSVYSAYPKVYLGLILDGDISGVGNAVYHKGMALLARNGKTKKAKGGVIIYWN